MFQTNIKVLEGTAVELRHQIGSLNHAIWEMESIISSLHDLAGMEGIRHEIGKELEEMELLKNQLSCMMTGMEEIAECYGICESNIISQETICWE